MAGLILSLEGTSPKWRALSGTRRTRQSSDVDLHIPQRTCRGLNSKRPPRRGIPRNQHRPREWGEVGHRLYCLFDTFEVIGVVRHPLLGSNRCQNEIADAVSGRGPDERMEALEQDRRKNGQGTADGYLPN